MALPFGRRQLNADDLRQEFQELAQAHEREIFNGALRMTGNRDDAADLTQDTFVKAFAAYARFERGTNFRAWLFRILTNTYINEYRRRTRGPSFVSQEDMPYEQDLAAHDMRPSDDPHDLAVHGVFTEEIQSALMALPEEFRTVVVLYDVNGLSYQEISEALGIPMGTVRSRLSRGRHQLYERLQDYARQYGLMGSESADDADPEGGVADAV